MSRIVENYLKSGVSALASLIHQRIEARKRAIEQEREFYRKLNAYCRDNNLSAICEDDWRTAAYAQDR
jgi:thiamine monophosphate synthase